jgi:putative selenium metabolism protein SsnA
MTLVLAGGTVVASLDPVVISRGDVVLDGDRVAAVGPDAPGGGTTGRLPARDPMAGAERVDCTGCLVIPGNVCAHTHVYSALARGMPYDLAPPRTFVEILRRIWWRLDRALDEDSVRASALVGGMEALLAGTTTLVDHHASPNAIDGSLDIVAEAFASLGLRSVLCYEVTDRDGPQRSIAGIRENARFAARVAEGATALARAMIGAHASFTLSEATLAGCVEAATTAGVGIHVHAAEDAADEGDAQRRFGLSVVERLLRAGALDERTLLAHGVHLDDDEATLVRESGATIAHNARSNMNNAVGRAPLDRLGSRVALGTDGIGADMIEESRAAFFRAREDGGTGDAGWTLARLAEGARLAGRAFDEPDLGRILPGAPADLVVLDYPAPAPVTAGSMAGHWVFGLGSRAVRDVVVAGRVVVRDRRLTRIDQDALAASARVDGARLWSRLDAIAEHPFDPAEAPVR